MDGFRLRWRSGMSASADCQAMFSVTHPFVTFSCGGRPPLRNKNPEADPLPPLLVDLDALLDPPEVLRLASSTPCLVFLASASTLAVAGRFGVDMFPTPLAVCARPVDAARCLTFGRSGESLSAPIWPFATLDID
jgi:hypothetical protein